MICPRCNKGKLVRRETENSVLLECSRRGEDIKARKCIYVEQYSKEEARQLERDAVKWAEACKPKRPE